MPENNQIYVFLMWMVTGGGAGWASRELLENWGWFQKQTPKAKLWLAGVCSALLGAGAYAVAVALAYQAAPVGAIAWAEALVAAGVAAAGVSQFIHSRKRMSA